MFGSSLYKYTCVEMNQSGTMAILFRILTYLLFRDLETSQPGGHDLVLYDLAIVTTSLHNKLWRHLFAKLNICLIKWSAKA